jgi:peptide deformylase
MALLNLRLVPDAVLREVAQPVAKITPAILQLMDDMLETMYEEAGVGLAAPQIGVLQRVIVIDVHAGKEHLTPQPLQMVNPEIIAKSEETSIYEEGCLSIPQAHGDVERPARVTVRYMDRDGQEQQIDADGLLATCVQHEIDHLNGVLFIDHLSPLKRNMVMRRYQKRQRMKDYD